MNFQEGILIIDQTKYIILQPSHTTNKHAETAQRPTIDTVPIQIYLLFLSPWYQRLANQLFLNYKFDQKIKKIKVH